MSLPANLRDVDTLEQALADAQNIAAAKGVPLTQERLAVTVGINRQRLSEIVNGRRTEVDGEKISREVMDTLKKAVNICIMGVMEHGMVRGNSPIMPIFALKCNHNYDDKPQSGATSVTVIINDKDIPD